MKRVVRRVKAGPGQQQLFGLPEGPEISVDSSPRDSFVDPSPEQLTIGPQSLRSYLVASGNEGVIEIRRLIRALDFDPFFARYERKGRTPYHPALMLGLVLYALMRGARSLRQIEALANENVCAWWITGGACPDHASVGRFVTRFSDLLQGPVFESLTSAILKETGTSGTDLAGDGTTIPSFACRFRLITEEAAQEKAQELRSQAESLDPERAPKERKRLEQKAATYERAAEAAQRVVKKTGRNPKTKSVRVALHDPESTQQRLKNGLPAPSYKPTILANEARIVVAHDVQSSSENAAVDGLCKQAKRVAESDTLDCVRFDAGFLSGDVLETLLDHNVENPLVTDRSVAQELRGKKPPKRFPKTEFVYDSETDTYTCPAGETLKLVKNRRVRRTKIYGNAPCESCELRDQCTNSKRNGRQIHRFGQDPVLDAMRDVMKHPLARAEYAKRSSMVEPVFADLRQRHGFTRFFRAGLAGVRLEFGLLALANNLMRYLSLWGKGLSSLGLLSLALSALWWRGGLAGFRGANQPQAGGALIARAA